MTPDGRPLPVDAIRDDLTLSGLNLIGQALSIFDADLRLAVANRQYQAMFDLPDALTRPGTHFEDTIRYLARRGEYGRVMDPESAVALRVAQARTFQPHYFERERADGRWVAVEGAPLTQGGWVTVYTDITDIKRQESLLRARSDALSEQVLRNAERLAAANRKLAATNAALSEAQRVLTRTEARTRQVTEMVPAHIAHMDAGYRYTFSNRRLPVVFPGAAGDIVGLTLDQALGAATAETLRPFMDRALAGEPQVFEITHPTSGRRIRIALTPDRDGQGVYILSTDVSAEVQAREALAHAARRNLAARLTSGMAHDFGNLLTIILGLQARLAARDLPPDAAEDVHGTLAAARRGAALLDRLARITGAREPALEPTDVAALLGDLAALARPSLAEGTRLDLALSLPAGQLLVDPGALQDSALNLILNANAAIAPPGVITLKARRNGDWLEVTVGDTGPGFTPEALTRATEPFFTTKKGQGSGLGLSMVYDQTKMVGGTMRLSNGPRGAQVMLRLPWRPVARRMVLLVEDDDQIRAEVRDQLTAIGHAVIEAATLTEARALADLPGLEVILSDLQLGDGLGTDLADALPAGVALVLMTSLPPGDPLRAAAKGPVLTKPFTPSRLAAILAAPDRPEPEAP
ncbi:response regulator [Paracoccus aestuarii]|uniref:histidine kinase n=1 Tax=Paracoccus aestuarii TaxID=453842 RepID=A0A419A2V9_9RHOB|nr:PAS-domain containing protein [Paracoccus aestuarii]RJL07597.1 response regulator [Paracoccus aestuarii]WCQ98983.1 PAS-domain containing protein [Paracoccus aestuarii]